MPKKKVDAYDGKEGKGIPIDEIGQGDGIEPVAEKDFTDAAKLEAFMNERVTVLVHPSPIPGELTVVTCNVNGKNQNFVRGKKVTVKRKYVEALARCTDTVYTQATEDPTKPHKKKMVPTTVPYFPFSVIEDKNPNGFPWLEALLNNAQAA